MWSAVFKGIRSSNKPDHEKASQVRRRTKEKKPVLKPLLVPLLLLVTAPHLLYLHTPVIIQSGLVYIQSLIRLAQRANHWLNRSNNNKVFQVAHHRELFLRSIPLFKGLIYIHLKQDLSNIQRHRRLAQRTNHWTNPTATTFISTRLKTSSSRSLDILIYIHLKPGFELIKSLRSLEEPAIEPIQQRQQQ